MNHQLVRGARTSSISLSHSVSVRQQVVFPQKKPVLEAAQCLLSMFKVRLHSGQSVGCTVEIVQPAKKQSSLNPMFQTSPLVSSRLPHTGPQNLLIFVYDESLESQKQLGGSQSRERSRAGRGSMTEKLKVTHFSRGSQQQAHDLFQML